MSKVVKNNENINEKLAQYSKSIGLSEVITLDDLIDSHARMRESVSEMMKEKNKNWHDSCERGYAAGIKQANQSLISIETLSKMTMLEISKLISDYN